MDDEFALCWNNFTDNITTGFQNLYDRGDLIDVTLACDGKLLHAHKIVLAICSPYFQEMFLTNPDKHPIIILKDVTFNVMCELLQFMYQGVVNVKQTELSSFMKIAQLLQIKGLTGSSNNNSNNSPKSPMIHTDHDHHQTATNSSSSLTQNPITSKSSSSIHNNNNNNNNNSNSNNNLNSPDTISSSAAHSSNNNNSNNNQLESKNSHSSTSQLQQQSHHSLQQQHQLSRTHISENSSSSISSIGPATANSSLNLKRLNDFPNDSLSIYSRKQMKRTVSELSEHHHNINSNDSIDHMNPEDVFLPPIPQITMGGGGSGGGTSSGSSGGNDPSAISSNIGNIGSNNDSRFNLINVKREISDHHSSRSISPNGAGNSNVSSLRSQLPHFNFEYNIYAAAAANKNLEYPNDLHLPNDFSKSTANHMDIPAVSPGEKWFHGKLEFMLSQRGKPLLVHDGHTFGIQYIRKDKKYWQCNLSRKYNCKARVTTTDTGEIIVTNNEHCHTEIRQHLRKDYQRTKILNAMKSFNGPHHHHQLQQHHDHHHHQQQLQRQSNPHLVNNFNALNLQQFDINQSFLQHLSRNFHKNNLINNNNNISFNNSKNNEINTKEDKNLEIEDGDSCDVKSKTEYQYRDDELIASPTEPCNNNNEEDDDNHPWLNKNIEKSPNSTSFRD